MVCKALEPGACVKDGVHLAQEPMCCVQEAGSKVAESGLQSGCWGHPISSGIFNSLESSTDRKRENPLFLGQKEQPQPLT